MNTILITVAGGPHEAIANVSAPQLERYAASIGSNFVVARHKIDENSNWSWNKVLWAKKFMDVYDYDKIILCDIDCVPLVMGVVPAPNFVNRMWASTDNNGICCGFLVIPNTEFMSNLINTWLFLGQMDHWGDFDTRDTWEHNTLKSMMYASPNVREMVEKISQKEVANPGTRGLEDLPIFYHAWANQGIENTVKTIKEVINSPEATLKRLSVMA